ncbi:putative uncharacterized protein DDB_G0282133 isoform X2 [Gordionus sp. m RMFG-2023]
MKDFMMDKYEKKMWYVSLEEVQQQVEREKELSLKHGTHSSSSRKSEKSGSFSSAGKDSTSSLSLSSSFVVLSMPPPVAQQTSKCTGDFNFYLLDDQIPTNDNSNENGVNLGHSLLKCRNNETTELGTDGIVAGGNHRDAIATKCNGVYSGSNSHGGSPFSSNCSSLSFSPKLNNGLFAIKPPAQHVTKRKISQTLHNSYNINSAHTIDGPAPDTNNKFQFENKLARDKMSSFEDSFTTLGTSINGGENEFTDAFFDSSTNINNKRKDNLAYSNPLPPLTKSTTSTFSSFIDTRPLVPSHSLQEHSTTDHKNYPLSLSNDKSSSNKPINNIPPIDKYSALAELDHAFNSCTLNTDGNKKINNLNTNFQNFPNHSQFNHHATNLNHHPSYALSNGFEENGPMQTYNNIAGENVKNPFLSRPINGYANHYHPSNPVFASSYNFNHNEAPILLNQDILSSRYNQTLQFNNSSPNNGNYIYQGHMNRGSTEKQNSFYYKPGVGNFSVNNNVNSQSHCATTNPFL